MTPADLQALLVELSGCLKIGRAVPAWQTLHHSPFDLDASLLPPNLKGPGAGAPVLVG
jgi:hypothetical protein